MWYERGRGILLWWIGRRKCPIILVKKVGVELRGSSALGWLRRRERWPVIWGREVEVGNSWTKECISMTSVPLVHWLRPKTLYPQKDRSWKWFILWQLISKLYFLIIYTIEGCPFARVLKLRRSQQLFESVVYFCNEGLLLLPVYFFLEAVVFFYVC